MRNIIKFILNNHFVLLFIFFELFSFILVIQFNEYQKVQFLSFTKKIDGAFHSRTSVINHFINYEKENERLVNENLRLRKELLKYELKVDTLGYVLQDTSEAKKFTFTPAKIINNSTNKQYNFLTINRGEKHGIKKDMGVISPEGVVGIIKAVSKNYSVAVSMLNRDAIINGKIKNTGHFGPITWDGQNYLKVQFNEIQFHAKVKLNDTIITSGYSTIFPENIVIGTISDFKKGGNNYEIEILLSNDFKELSNVYIIDNVQKEEQFNLEIAQ